MNAKMKSCFTPHTLMHSLFGFGLALFLVHFFPQLNSLWLGLLAMIVATVLDVMRKG